jgi:hydrogenase expression/formation protein HypE
MLTSQDFTLTCPIPISDYPRVLLAHGGGGRLMHQLIGRLFRTAFDELGLQADLDAAVLEMPPGRLAFTTDSFVVHPLHFPGGDIGSMAVYGSVNDLATSGARAVALSIGFIIEEGLPMETLWGIVQSIAAAAKRAQVRIVTGDTKVVDRGKGDGLFINTSGLGIIEHDLVLGPHAVEAGDAVLINGDLGRHGMAIMAVREGLEFETSIESDSAPLNHIVQALLEGGVVLHALRDLTRGGLASALNEIAATRRLELRIDERAIPVREDVRGACEILGFDPLYVANEGRLVAFVPRDHAANALRIMQAHPEGAGAAQIGEVSDREGTLVRLRSHISAERILDMLSGEQLPRIC